MKSVQSAGCCTSTRSNNRRAPLTRRSPPRGRNGGHAAGFCCGRASDVGPGLPIQQGAVAALLQRFNNLIEQDPRRIKRLVRPGLGFKRFDTAMGHDRLGIADDISKLVTNRGGSIIESKMAVLGGEFAAIVLISIPSAAVDALESVLGSLEQDLKLYFSIKLTTPPRAVDSDRAYTIECVSFDSPQLLERVTSILIQHGINIEELETSIQPAPLTGTPMFRMRATVILGAEVTVSLIKESLSQLEREEELHVSFTPASCGAPS